MNVDPTTAFSFDCQDFVAMTGGISLDEGFNGNDGSLFCNSGRILGDVGLCT